MYIYVFFFSSRRRHTRSYGDWSSDVCSSDLVDRRAGRRRHLDHLAGGARELEVVGVGRRGDRRRDAPRSEEHTSELQSPYDLVCRLLLEKKKHAETCERV